MIPLRVLLSRLADVVMRSRRDDRLDEEIDTHLALLADDYVARGMPVDDARRAARRDFGRTARVADTYRDQRGLPALDALLLDLRLGVRLLAREWRFAAAAILVLSAGIGVNTMLFTILNAHTIRGLPIAGADRVVHISLADHQGRPVDFTPDWLRLLDRSTTLASIGGFASLPIVLGDEGHVPDRVEGAVLTAGTFDVIPPALLAGRLFTASDSQPGAEGVAMISDRVWSTRYGSSADVFERPVLINGTTTRIVGIFSVRSRLPLTADLWLPASLSPSSHGAQRSLQIIGRLRDDATTAGAKAEVEAALREPGAASDGDTVLDARVVPINERYFGRLTDTVWLAFMSVGILVVLISCANVANLLIERSLHRAREIAIRASLGASRRRVVRQLLVESAVLAAAGGSAGLVLAMLGVRGFRSLIPENALPYWYDYSLDWRVVAVLLGVSAATVLVFGLVPAIGAARVDVNRVLKAGRVEARVRASRWTTAFLTVELALTVIMLANLALGLRLRDRTPAAERTVDRPDIVTASITLTGIRYATPGQRVAFFRSLEERLGASAGAPVAAIASMLPMSGATPRTLLSVRAPFAPKDAPVVATVAVGPHYFNALGLTMLAGRELEGWNAPESAPLEVVVNERFAEMFLNGASPVGERIVLQGTPGAPAPTTVEIVGEAPSMRQRVRPDAEPVVYLRLDASAPSTVSLIARGSGDPAALAAGIRQDLLALDPAIPLYRVSTMAQTLRDVNWNGRVSAALMRFLALLALGLSMTGMYAVTAYAASRRAGEIAVRMALGARPRHVGWLLLRRAALQAALGFAVGVACTFLWGHAFASGQAGTGVTDLQPLVIAGALIASVTALTAIGPIRRAVLSDPVSVLRSE